MPRSRVQALGLAIFAVATAALLLCAFPACTALDGYERGYSLSYTDGDRAFGGSVTLRSRDGKSVRPPEGPATAQRHSRAHGYNFGGPGK